ncbi:MAG: amidohydrolase family protein, partial [Vicinamibacterales bacterium]|nr:amidohydrolase family protein [Vicinamibacterales bacterium]
MLTIRRRLSFCFIAGALLAATGCTQNSSDISSQATPADLVVTNAHIVTMNDRREVIESGAVVIQGSQIVAVGPASIATGYKAAKTIDAGGGIVMPGLINTHTHVSMTVFRGLGDDVPDRLRTLIFPLEKALIDRELVYWGGLHGMIEMIEGGVTTFADMYYFEDEVAKAATKIGLRGVLGETIVNFPAPDAAEPYGGLAYARTFVAAFQNNPLITPALAPHAPYSLDEAHLRLVAKEADALNTPVLIHVAEMTDEVETLRKERHQTPVEYLDAIGLLSRRVVAAHCILVNDTDIQLLKQRDAGVAHA